MSQPGSPPLTCFAIAKVALAALSNHPEAHAAALKVVSISETVPAIRTAALACAEASAAPLEDELALSTSLFSDALSKSSSECVRALSAAASCDAAFDQQEVFAAFRAQRSLLETRRTRVDVLRAALDAAAAGQGDAAASLAAVHAELEQARDELRAVAGAKDIYTILYCMDLVQSSADMPAHSSQPVGVPISGEVIGPDGFNVMKDHCDYCWMMIPTETPRRHCLECSGFRKSYIGAMCLQCFSIACLPISAIASGSGVKSLLHKFPRLRSLVDAAAPHALHLTVQDPLSPPFLLCSISTFDQPPAKILQSLFCAYAPRPCFSRLAVTSSSSLSAQRGTYEQAGAAVAAVELALVVTLGRGCVIALSLHGCPLCYILEMAAVSADGASAGANAQWPGSHLAAVLKLSAADALFITTDAWLQFRQYLSSTAVVLPLRLVVLVDGYEDYGVEASLATTQHEEAAESAAGSAFGTVVVCTFRSLLSHSVSVPPPSFPPALRPRILIFSSGTTGLPKGIIVSATDFIRQANKPKFGPHRTMSLFPPGWGADKLTVWSALLIGGEVVFPAPAVPLLTSIAAAQPTSILLVPALASSLRSTVEAEVRALQLPPAAAHFARVERANDALGGRVVEMGIGGAAVDDSLVRWLRQHLASDLGVGYGTSEAGGITSDGVVSRGVDLILQDVPELCYTNSDLPNPRGEICVRSPELAQRDDWLVMEGETDVSTRYLSSGHLKTGDIGERLPDGRVIVIDRIAAHFKLSCGLFVAPERVERALMKACSHIIFDVVVASGGSGAFVAAIVRPLHADAVSADILASLQSAARSAGLSPHEVPMMAIVDHEPWPTDHVRSEYKKNRKQIATRFAARLKEANFANAHETTPTVEELSEPLDEYDASAPMLRHWLHELRSLIAVARSGVGSPPLPSSASPPHVLLSDLGLDSLSTSTLLSLLRARLLEACHRTFWGQTPPPFSYASLMSSSLGEVARACVDVITKGADDAAAAVAASFDTVRLGPPVVSDSFPPQNYEASERTPRRSSSTLAPMALHAQIAQDVRDCVLRAAAAAAALSAEPLATPSPPHSGDVLLTGAAGYLGVHLALALAEALPSSCRVLCLVRSAAGSDAGAAQRLFAAAAGFNVDLASLGARIVPLCGDVSQPLLGLQQDVYCSLSLRAIVHAAAAVKFIEGSADEGYSMLRSANVLPMQHLLSLAVACSHARGGSFHFHYVSTASVPMRYGQLCRSALQLETFIKESTHSADGYALSKLACETALCEAADSGHLFGAYATLCRPGLLTWSTRQGAANNDDWANRLLATCLQFGCVPDVTEGGSHAKGWAAPIEHSAVDCFATVLARRFIDHVSVPLRFLPTPRRSGCEVFTLAAALGALQEALSLRAVAAKVWVQAVVHADPALGLRFSPLAGALLGGDGSLKVDSLFDPKTNVQGLEGDEDAQSWRLGLDKFLRSLAASQGRP